MLLAIDIGNTNIVFGIYNSDKWTNTWRIQTDALKTADEYEVIFNSLFQMDKINFGNIEKIVICSVVPTLVTPFCEMLNGLIGKEPLFLTNEIFDKLPVKVLNPNQIGSDLVANSVAAFSKYGDNTMVVDFGTALTFTTIGRNGEILGVSIAPGLRTAMGSLAGKTAQLPFVQIKPPPSVLGDNTTHAIQSGIVHGYTGLVDFIIEKTEEELKQKLNIVATGGLSSEISPLTKNIKVIEKSLTLEGLRIISELI